jgi:manganese/zinc/iron transport system permease protein
VRPGRLLALGAVAGAFVLASARPAGAVPFTSGKDVTWDSIRADARSFLSNLFLGGVDADGDGRLSEGERAVAGAFRAAVAACILAGLGCGLLGSFIILRRMTLFGDMLGHAVLPGVAAGFIVAAEKSTPYLLGGALIAGLLAAGLTRAIRGWSRVKEDAALGISLSFFYACGIWLLSWITREPRLSAEASGLNHYLFGNPAVISGADLAFLAAAAMLVVLVVIAGYRGLLACTFDAGFARSIGLPFRSIEGAMLVLLTVVIVVSIKILGIVLVAALLAIPPAAAYLLTDRLERLCLGAALIGAGAGFGGSFLSAVLHIGAGPAIISLAFLFLLGVFLLAPRHGILGRWIRHRRLALRTARENILASAYRVLERGGSPGGAALRVPLEAIARERREPLPVIRALARKLRRSGWGGVEGGELVLSAAGRARAQQVLRGHRLWELFLSREASLPADHVHQDAEDIEHYLSEEAILELEKLLGDPRTDPHGRRIPPATASAPGDGGGGRP